MEVDSSLSNNAFFMLPTNMGIESVDTDRLIRVEASSNYSKLYFKEGNTLVVAKTLKWFENRLPVNTFIRVHSKHLINKKTIHQYINQGAGKFKLENGDLIGISRRRKVLFNAILHHPAT